MTSNKPKTVADGADILARRLWATSPSDAKAELLPGERAIYPHERVKWMAGEIREFMRQRGVRVDQQPACLAPKEEGIGR